MHGQLSLSQTSQIRNRQSISNTYLVSCESERHFSSGCMDAKANYSYDVNSYDGNDTGITAPRSSPSKEYFLWVTEIIHIECTQSRHYNDDIIMT